MNEISPALVICQRSSLTRLHQRVQDANSVVAPKRFKKTINGQEIEYERQAKAITGSVEATMERLIKDYVKDYHRILKTTGPSALDAGMPSLQTCRSTLANRRTISEKTAYNHLRKLREMGLITAYKFRGSRHAFEIWIDPALLFQPERPYPQPVHNAPEALENQPQKIASLLPQTANFTAYKVTVTHSNVETENKADGNVDSDAQKQKHGDKKHGNTERLQPNLPPKWQTSSLGTPCHSDEAPGGAAGAVECGQVDNPVNPRSAGQRAKARLNKTQLEERNEMGRTPAQRQAILEGYLTSFWGYAKTLLYPAKAFADYEEPLIMNAIRAGVYRNFQPQLTEKEWDAYQSELYRRIELAAGYYERHPDKWVPAPFAQIRPGTGYFDEANQRGFSNTLTWLEENKRNYQKNYTTQQINLAVRHLQLHKIDKAPRAIQLKSYIEAYRYYEHKLARFGPDAVKRFQTLVATIGDRKPKLTLGFNKNFKK